MRALGVAPLAAHLRGRAARWRTPSRSAKAETRQYAKRQLTWLQTKYDCVEDHYIRNKWKVMLADRLAIY